MIKIAPLSCDFVVKGYVSRSQTVASHVPCSRTAAVDMSHSQIVADNLPRTRSTIGTCTGHLPVVDHMRSMCVDTNWERDTSPIVVWDNDTWFSMAKSCGIDVIFVTCFARWLVLLLSSRFVRLNVWEWDHMTGGVFFCLRACLVGLCSSIFSS